MKNDAVMISLIKEYLSKGESKLYKSLLSQSVRQIALLEGSDNNFKVYPDQTLLSISNKFLQEYRLNGDESYLEVSKILRKVAHKIYRLLLKKHLISKNKNFLNLV